MPSDRIRRIVQQFIADLEQATRLDVQEELKRLVDGMAQPQRSATTASPQTPKTKKKRKTPPHCVRDDCVLPHGGPGRSYLCKQHFDEREGAKKEGSE